MFGAKATLRKAMSIQPSIRPHGVALLTLTDFYEI
jgi:hypothetical protein